MNVMSYFSYYYIPYLSHTYGIYSILRGNQQKNKILQKEAKINHDAIWLSKRLFSQFGA